LLNKNKNIIFASVEKNNKPLMCVTPLNIEKICKKVAENLLISKLCIHTQSYLYKIITTILVIVKNSKSQSPLWLNTLCLYPIKNIKPLIKKL
jgi:hypothetical protein